MGSPKLEVCNNVPEHIILSGYLHTEHFMLRVNRGNLSINCKSKSQNSPSKAPVVACAGLVEEMCYCC